MTDANLAQRLLRRVLYSRLTSLSDGSLTIDWEGDRRTFGAGEPSATVSIHDPRAFTGVALRGTIGAAEAFMEGMWSTDDLTALVRIFARNQNLNEGMEAGLARLGGWLYRLTHRARSNTPVGSRRNISAHYDLGNEFFGSFLDSTMMYSCAVFPTPDASLEEASRYKMDMICRKLQLSPDDELVEIGTGWGGFAVHAARDFGCRVLSTTISGEQHAHARRLVDEAGLAERIEIVRADYRDLPQLAGRRFDKLVSIEMIEAVGEKYLTTYLTTCQDLLKVGGRGLIQAIVIDDMLYDRYCRSVDFIQRHVFPGSFLPSLKDLLQRASRNTALEVIQSEDITPHYARTLRAWRNRFLSQVDRLRHQGYADEFLRLWEYYLCYCEGGFLERTIGDVQLLFRHAPAET